MKSNKKKNIYICIDISIKTKFKIFIFIRYQELISTAWVEMSWQDNRFKWNPVDFDNVKIT